MAIQKPRGTQLDVTSLATELTTDSGALAVLDAEYARVDNTNNVSGVDLTSDQTISGEKTFSDTLTVNADFVVNGTVTTVNTADLAIVDNIITVNDGETGAGISLGSAGMEIDRGTLPIQSIIFDEADDKWKVGETGSLLDIATEDYVDANFLGKSGDQTITDTNDLYFSLDAGGNPILMFKHDGTSTGRIYANSGSFNITHYDENDAQSNIKMYPTYTLADKPIIIGSAQSTNVGALTRKDYVDDNFLKLSGGTMTGDLKTSGNIEIDTVVPRLFLDANAGNDSAMYFRADGKQRAVLFNDESVERFKILKYADDGTTVDNYLEMRGDLTYFLQPVLTYAAQHTNVNALTRKDYVDTTFLKKTGGTLTGQFNIDAGTPIFELRSVAGNDAVIGFKEDSTDTATIYHDSSSGRLRFALRDGSTIVTELDLRDDFVYSTKAVLCGGTQHTSPHALTRKDYVDTTFLTKAGTTTNGNLTITRDTDFDTYLELDAYAGRNGIIRFQADNVDRAYIRGLEAQLQLVHSNSGSGDDSFFALYDDSAAINVPLTGATPTNAGHLTRKDYVDSNFLSNTGDQTLAGNFTTTGGLLVIKGATENAASNLQWRSSDGTVVADQYVEGTGAKRLIMRKRTGGTVDNQIYIENDSIVLQDDPRTSNMGSVGSSLTTKEYVDFGFLKVTGGESTGALSVKHASPYMTLDSTSGNCNFQMRMDGKRDTLLYTTGTLTYLTQYESDQVTAANYIAFDKAGHYIQTSSEIRGVDGSGSNTLTTKGYVDDNKNVVQQAPGYSMVMPTSAGTVGQQLQVISVSGTVLTMGWV